MPIPNRHRREPPPKNRQREKRKRRKPLKPDRKVSPKHPAVVFEFLGTRLGDSEPKLFKTPRIVIHRPNEPGAIYKYRRLDGAPVSDADLDLCWKCGHCNPKPGPTIDVRKTS